jgi:methyl-accepting chemotaxis protein/methyl-accepting chemotaxis protein-1 (serine sensor receptor)
MDEIVGSIRRVSDIVAEITAATVVQSAGSQQVGDAVGQMDQVTQQNASLVEESAAAAESLKSQAQQLVQAVAVFRLAEDAYAAPGADVPASGAPVQERGAERTPAVLAAVTKPKDPAPAPSPRQAGATTAKAEDWTTF